MKAAIVTVFKGVGKVIKGLLVVVLIILFYGHYIEPYSLNKVVVPISFKNRALYEADDSITALHLTDLHVCDKASVDLFDDAVTAGLASNPDIIFLTGDFITRHLTVREDYVKALKRLSGFAPTYACLGNHDGGNWSGRHYGEVDTDEVVKLLKDGGVRCLVNEVAFCTVKGAEIRIVGLGDLWAGYSYPSEKLFSAVKTVKTSKRSLAAADYVRDDVDYFTILLSHNPDTRPGLERFKWDLMLSGHTHGGQMDIPFIGNIYVPVYNKVYTKGLHRSSNHTLYVSCGVGCTIWFRFNLPPGVTVLRLKSEE